MKTAVAANEFNIYLETHNYFSLNYVRTLIFRYDRKLFIMSTAGDCECREAQSYSLT